MDPGTQQVGTVVHAFEEGDNSRSRGGSQANPLSEREINAPYAYFGWERAPRPPPALAAMAISFFLEEVFVARK